MDQFKNYRKLQHLLIWTLIFLGLYLTSLYSYPLFHSLAEIFSVAVAYGIFMIAWNSRQFFDNNYLIFIGIAYVFVGGLDLIHTLAYKGMGLFPGYEANLPTQLWIAARYMQSISFLIAPLLFRRKLKFNLIFLAYTIATSILLLSIFYWDVFPVCFIEGVGLTPFKKISEYIISLTLLGSIFLLFKNRREFDNAVLKWLIGSIVFAIASEVSFTFYIHAYGFSNLVGHFLKILSFYFIYKAIIETGLTKPYKLLFRNLKQSEEDLQKTLRETKQRQAEVSALLAGSRAILEYHKFKDSARSIFDSCKNLIGATAGYIALLSKDGAENEVLFLDSGGSSCTVDPSLPMPIRGLREETYRTGKTVFHNDFPNSRYMKYMPEGHVNLNNVLFSPLVVSGTVIGLLGIANKPGGFTENDARMASAFGELAAIALHNSRMLESLEKSEEHFRSVVQTANDAIISIDKWGNIIFWNNSAENIFGYSAEEVTGKPLTFLMPERFREAHQKGMNQMISTGQSKMIGKTVEVVGLRKDGSEFPVELSLATWKTGEETFFTGIIRDITERKQTEELLRRSHDELETRVQERTAELAKANKELADRSRILESFFKHTLTPLVFLDRNFNFIRVNEAYAKACQRDISEFPGHNHFEFYPSDAKAIFEKVVQTKEPYQAIARPFTFPDHSEWGVTYWNWTLTPILDEEGEVEFLVFSLEDVTERRQAREALKAERQRFNDLLEMLPVYLVLLTPDHHVPFANRFFRERFGESHGQRCFEYLFGRSEPCEICETYTALKTMAPHEWEWTGPDGRNYDVFDFPFTDTDGSTLILEMGIDITERKEIENRTNATNALLNLFAKKTSRKEYLDAVVELIRDWSKCRCVGIRVLDERGFIPYESYIGFSQEFWESENWLSVQKDQCICIRVVTGKSDLQDNLVITPGGSFRCDNTIKFVNKLSEEEKSRYRGVCIQNGFLSVTIIPIHYLDKIVGAIHLADEKEAFVPSSIVEFLESIAPLIGEAVNRFRLEEEVRESEQRLRSLSSQLLTAQENERKQIARDLHDGIGQMLSAIKFKIEDTLQKKGKGRAKLMAEDIHTLISMIRGSIEEVRKIQMDLRPSTLDDLGIVATIGWFCREFQKIYSTIHIEKQLDVQENEIAARLKTVIYRILQEAMNNIAKHSKADFMHLFLKKKDGRIELMIRDNGAGFDLENSKGGFGLDSMRERTELSGGTFTTESTPGSGTTIWAIWPI